MLENPVALEDRRRPFARFRRLRALLARKCRAHRSLGACRDRSDGVGDAGDAPDASPKASGFGFWEARQEGEEDAAD